MMVEAEALGMVLLALSTILGVFAAIAKPLLRLDQTITKLELTLNQMERHADALDNTINTHEHRLDVAEDRLTEHDYRLRRIEEDGKI